MLLLHIMYRYILFNASNGIYRAGDLHVKNCSGQSVLLTFVNKGG